MNKYYGAVGYAITEETSPGVWEPKIIERNYYGDITKNYKRFSGNDKVNNDIELGNNFSIIADPYAYENFHSIVYITYMGIKWKVSGVEVLYPRLLLSVGGRYNYED